MSVGCNGASERGSRDGAGYQAGHDAGPGGQSGTGAWGGAAGFGGIGHGGMGLGGGGAPQPGPVPDTEVGKAFLINCPSAAGALGFYLRVVSTTEAEVTPSFGLTTTMPIAHVSGAPLGEGTAPATGGKPGKLTGSYLVGNEPPMHSAGEYSFYDGMFALSESSAGGIGEGGIYLRQELKEANYCRAAPTETFSTMDCTVQADDTPTEVIFGAENPFDSGVLPWEAITIVASKPAMLPLSDALTATLGGDQVALTWATSSNTHSASFMVSDWAKAVGRSLILSGSVASTNGVSSPITLDIPVVDFGPVREQKVDFSADLPPDLGVPAGSVTHVASGANDACPAGCALLSTGTTLVARLAGAGGTVRLKALAVADPSGPRYPGSFSVQLAREGASSVAIPSLLIQRAQLQSATTLYDLAVGDGTGDLFVVISVPQGVDAPDACVTLYDIDLFLESIELVEN